MEKIVKSKVNAILTICEYQANDGKIFKDEAQCLAYEKKIS